MRFCALMFGLHCSFLPYLTHLIIDLIMLLYKEYKLWSSLYNFLHSLVTYLLLLLFTLLLLLLYCYFWTLCF
jgi:hypothetical protein